MFKLSQIPKERYDEVMGHLDSSQGGDLKSLLMEALSKKEASESPMDESKESPEMQSLEDKMGTEMHGDSMDKPKGLSVEKISVVKNPKDMAMDKANPLSGRKGGMGMGDKMDDMSDELTKPDEMSDNEEMSDDELKELLDKYLS